MAMDVTCMGRFAEGRFYPVSGAGGGIAEEVDVVAEAGLGGSQAEGDHGGAAASRGESGCDVQNPHGESRGVWRNRFSGQEAVYSQ